MYFQNKMINIGILLDVCNISYNEDQLAKLEKLINDLIQKYFTKCSKKESFDKKKINTVIP